MKSFLKFATALTVLAILAACAGSHASRVLPAARMGSMTIVIKVPPKPAASTSAGISPKYMSPATQSVAIRAGSKPVYANVTPGSPNCSTSAGTTTCTFQNVGAGIGTASIQIDAYDQPFGGKGLPQGNDLSSAWETTAQIVEGQVNVIPITLGGIPAKATLTLDGSPQNGVVSDLHAHLSVMDADGYVIMPPGPYNAPNGVGGGVGISASTTNPGGNTDLIFSVNGVDQPFSQALLQSPKDVLAVRYTGRGLNSATVTVTLNSDMNVKAWATVVPVPFFGPNTTVNGVTGSSGAALGVSIAGAGAPSQQTLFFSEPGSASIGTINEAGTYAEYHIASGHIPQRITYGHPFIGGPPPGTQGYSMFFSETANFIGEVDNDGTIKEYAIPTANAGVYDICCTGGSLQYVFFTEKNVGKIGTIQPGGFFLEHPIGIAGSAPAGIAIGPNGAPWFADPGTNAVGYIDGSYVAHEFPLPQAGSIPTEVTPGPLNMLWFTEGGASRVGAVDGSGVIHEYPANAPLTHITMGPDFNIYALDTSGQIEQFDGTTGAMRLMPVTAPAAGAPVALVRGIHEDLLLLRTGAVNEFLY